MHQEEIILKILKEGAILLTTKKQLSKLNHTNGNSLYLMVLTEQPSLQLGEKAMNQDLDPMAVWELQSLINQFFSLFEALIGLPPKRRHDHHIPLKDEAQVVKMRPYRYLVVQKNEIEKMIKEMKNT